MEKQLYSIKDMVSLKMKTLHQKISAKDIEEAKLSKIKLPLVVSIHTEDVENEDFRQGLDLVVLIDISGSMKGEKIKLVKDTLEFVIDELDERDRLSVITFNSRITQLCGLKSMTKPNKEALKKLCLEKIKPKGCTNIRKAMDSAFNLLLDRGESNDSTAIFLVSDGQDTCGNNIEHIKKSMDTKIQKLKDKGEVFQVHAFGYGEDHDEEVLDMISRGCSGHFYYIKTLTFIDECFIDCFGYLMSSFGSNVEVEIHLSQGIVFESIVPGSWEKKTNRVALIKVPVLAVGKTLNYTAEISIDVKKHTFKKGKEIKIGKIDMSFTSSGETFTLEDTLNLMMVKNHIEKGEIDTEVDENYVKFQALKLIEESKKKLYEGKEKEADWMVDDFLFKMNERNHLGSRFKKDMFSKMSKKNMRSNKCTVQVQHMLRSNVCNAELEEYGEDKMNYRQRKMKKRRKG